MPTNERNSWDRANKQGENQTDFNRNKSERDYDLVKQEPADSHRTDTVNPIETQDEDNLDSEQGETPEFLTYGTSDQDIQF